MASEMLETEEAIKSYRMEQVVFGSQGNMTKVDGSEIESKNTSIYQSIEGVAITFFDKENKPIAEIEPGHMYVTGMVMEKNDLQPGDVIRFQHSGVELEFILDGIAKDALLGSDLMGNTRFLMSDTDMQKLLANETIYEHYRGEICYIDTDDVKGLDHELAWTVELAGHWKQLRYETAYIARGMYLDQKVNPLPTQWAEGWYAQASWLLFGGTQNYDADGAKYTRTTSERKWGNLEVAFRYEYADFNTGKLFSNKIADTNIFGGSGEAYTVGLNYYPTKNVKIVLNWQYNNNDRYANAKGKSYVGYDDKGVPTKDPKKVAAPQGKAGVDYQMLALRFQVAF